MPRLESTARKLCLLTLAVLIAAGAFLGALPRPGASAWAAPPSSGTPVSFSDLSAHWARREIEALLARGAVEGTEGPYEPDVGITRGEFVALLVRALGYGPEAEVLEAHGPLFTDVSTPGSLVGQVNVGAEYSLVRGYPDGSFGADRPITRAEISALLVRVIGLDPGEPGSGGLPFADRDELPGWAAGYISVAYERGMVRGYPDRTFRPESGATRAEAACLVYRAACASGLLFDLTGIVRGVSATGDLLAVDLWPSATPSVTPGASDSIVFTAPHLIQPSGPGPTVYLRVPVATIVYRNGERASTAAVFPLDEVSLILGTSGKVTFIESFRLDGAGRVVEAEFVPSGEPIPARLKLEPLGGGETRLFEVAPWAPIFRDGEQQTPAPGDGPVVRPGDVAYFVLDRHSGVIRAVGLFESGAAAAVSGPMATAAEALDPGAIAFPRLSPAGAMALNSEVVGAPALSALSGSDGRGVVIAVIDTGVDVSHPDLIMSTLLERKVVDWRDFSGEGDVTTTRISPADPSGIIHTDLGPAKVSGIVSQSGFYHTGVLSETQLNRGSPLGQDLDQNGAPRDRYLVLVTDRRTPGVYDTVYIDTNRDLDLTDEIALRPFRESGLVAWFGAHNRPRAERCPFVVSDIRSDGNRVTLGFDGNGHGTHVAAVAAAYGSYRGGLDGIAPGAQIMALKALGSSGDGTWSRITEAVEYAARQGAHIIILSVANLSGGGDLTRDTANLASIADRYGCLLIVAAGNTGPGLATAFGPGGRPALLTVGAALSPAMWRAFYGYDVPEETVWPFSAVGPRCDGSGGPDILAPGCAVSAAPLWLEPTGYVQAEGTSMAVPHVAGVGAMLWRAALMADVPVTSGLVREALTSGARFLPGYAFVEQGYGRVDALSAWHWLTQAADAGGPKAPGLRATGGDLATGGDIPGYGFYSRDLTGSARFVLEVGGSTPASSTWVHVESDSPWLTAEKAHLALPAGIVRTLAARAEATGEGLLSGRLYARDGLHQAFSYPVTIVTPARFSPSTQWRLSLEGRLGPARLARHFFEVPPGAGVLDLSFGIPDDSEMGYAGRARIFVHDPGGRQVVAGDYVGTGAAAGHLTLTLEEPASGVWEIVVYSSAALSAFELQDTTYWLEAGVAGLIYELPTGGWDVTVPLTGSAGAPDLVSLAALLGPAWRPPAEVDSLGRPSQAWGGGWAVLPGGADGGVLSPASVEALFGLANAADAFEAGFEGYGLWTSSWAFAPETYTLRAGETLPVILPGLGGATGAAAGKGLLRVQVRNVITDGWHKTHPELDLYLYRRVGTGWLEYASSTLSGLSSELIEVVNPPQGEYAVYVEASILGAGSVSFELWAQWLESGSQVQVTPSRFSLGPGQGGCSLSVRVELPTEEGVYSGAVRAIDRDGSLGAHDSRPATVGVVPVTVRRVGEPVQLVLAQGSLVPGRNHLTFRAFTRSGEPVPRFTLEAGGRRYEALFGVVTLPWDVGAFDPITAGPGDTRRITAVLHLPGGAGFTWAFHLPALSGTGGDEDGWKADGSGAAWLEGRGFRPGTLETLRTSFDSSLPGS